jgi:hypothetical protein
MVMELTSVVTKIQRRATMPGKKHLPAVGAKENRMYEHIKVNARTELHG